MRKALMASSHSASPWTSPSIQASCQTNARHQLGPKAPLFATLRGNARAAEVTSRVAPVVVDALLDTSTRRDAGAPVIAT